MSSAYILTRRGLTDHVNKLLHSLVNHVCKIYIYANAIELNPVAEINCGGSDRWITCVKITRRSLPSFSIQFECVFHFNPRVYSTIVFYFECSGLLRRSVELWYHSFRCFDRNPKRASRLDEIDFDEIFFANPNSNGNRKSVGFFLCSKSWVSLKKKWYQLLKEKKIWDGKKWFCSIAKMKIKTENDIEWGRKSSLEIQKNDQYARAH